MFISRLRTIVIETYKSINKLNPAFLHDLFVKKCTGHDLRGAISLNQPKYDTVKYGFNSIRYQGARLWNQLPPEFRCEESNIQMFKTLVKKWNGPKCECGFCCLCKLSYV